MLCAYKGRHYANNFTRKNEGRVGINIPCMSINQNIRKLTPSECEKITRFSSQVIRKYRIEINQPKIARIARAIKLSAIVWSCTGY